MAPGGNVLRERACDVVCPACGTPSAEPEYDRETRSADAGNHLRYFNEAHVSFTSYPAGACTELPIRIPHYPKKGRQSSGWRIIQWGGLVSWAEGRFAQLEA